MTIGTTVTLDQLLAGESGHISELTQSNNALFRQCQTLGLTLGAKIEVLHRSMGNGPMQIKCEGTLYAIRANEAEFIRVIKA